MLDEKSVIWSLTFSAFFRSTDGFSEGKSNFYVDCKILKLSKIYYKTGKIFGKK